MNFSWARAMRPEGEEDHPSETENRVVSAVTFGAAGLVLGGPHGAIEGFRLGLKAGDYLNEIDRQRRADAAASSGD